LVASYIAHKGADFRQVVTFDAKGVSVVLKTHLGQAQICVITDSYGWSYPTDALEFASVCLEAAMYGLKVGRRLQEAGYGLYDMGVE